MKLLTHNAFRALILFVGALLSAVPAHAGSSITLTGAVNTSGGSPVVQLQWRSNPTGSNYEVFRDGRLLATFGAVSQYTDATPPTGQTHTYLVLGWGKPLLLPVYSNTVSLQVAAPKPQPPAAPTGLTAAGVWNPGTSGGAAGPKINLTWQPSSGATGYNVYRGGTLLQSGLTQTQAADLSAASGQSYSYAVTAVGPGGESAKSAAVSATAPKPPAPAAPTGLTATGVWNAASSAPTVQLTWGSVTGASGYNIYRNGSLLQSGATTTGFTDAGVSSSQSYSYAVTAVGPGGESAKSAAVSATAPNPPAPAAPTGLTADALWDPDCVECNDMAMPEIDLTWTASTGATGYSVYRNGALLQAGLTGPAFNDMAVVSGQTYAYTVTAAGPGGTSAPSASVSATAPNPPVGSSGMTLTPPTNLAIHDLWQGASSDVLTWDPVPGAVSYNVYQYDVLVAKGVTGTSYTLPFSVFYAGLTDTVTAVDATGMESIPSNIVENIGGYDPNNLPSWIGNWDPGTPSQLVVTPEWNAGLPRVALAWQGLAISSTYTVYRDGKPVATGLWGLHYIDNGVKPGESHTYSVAGVNDWWPAKVVGTPTAGVSVTALTGPPALSGKVQINGVVANDDSAVVRFAPVPGATDYRLYDVSTPGKAKYLGRLGSYTSSYWQLPTEYSIEMNGIDPTAGANLVVEAVDKLGPFQKMDGSAGPGAMQMDGTMSTATNGQGDPSNVPNVLSRSDVTHVTCQPRSLTDSQAFFDNFRNEKPLAPSASIDPSIWAWHSNTMSQAENDKWVIRDYEGDLTNTQVFFMGNHFMDTLFDGGTPSSNDPIHNNNASLVMMPKPIGDISGGKVLHVTFEVDSHFEGRRWCDVFIGAAGDPLLNPGKFAENNFPPTLSNNVFRWEIHDSSHFAELFLPATGGGASPTQQIDLMQANNDTQSFERTGWDGCPELNGTPQDLDKRHRFDLYLSKTHFRIMETRADGTFGMIRDKDFPAGTALPFDQCQVYFVHQLYHTGNDRDEQVNNGPNGQYWYNYRPYSDERHWDNMGFEVLPSFPSLPVSVN